MVDEMVQRDRRWEVKGQKVWCEPCWLDDRRLVHKELGGCGPNGSPGDCVGTSMDVGMYIINCRVPGALWTGIKIGAGENGSWEIPQTEKSYSMQACTITTPCVYICTLIYTHVSIYTMCMYDWCAKHKLCSHLGKSSQERFCILGSSLCTRQQPEYPVIFFPGPKVLRTYFQIKYTLIFCNEHSWFAWSRAAGLLSMISKMIAWKRSPPFHSPPLPQESPAANTVSAV